MPKVVQPQLVLWFDIKKVQPTETKKVLVYGEGQMCLAEAYVCPEYKTLAWVDIVDDEDFLAFEITHWCELPLPPEK
jgi:hypothetical protein